MIPASIDHLLDSFPLNDVSVEELTTHYGAEEAHAMLVGVPAKYHPCLNIPGIASRHRQFARSTGTDTHVSLRDAVEEFSRELGSVKTCRALVLSETQYENILSLGKIVAPGGLKASLKQLQQQLQLCGVTSACKLRLFPMSRPRGYIDPTYSVYDDAETTLCISGGYMRPGARIYLFEIEMPLIETHGKPISFFSEDHSQRWFQHRDVWFDAMCPKTERFCFFEVPFLMQRLVSVSSYEAHEIEGLIGEFRLLQLALKHCKPVYAFRHGVTEYKMGNERMETLEARDLTAEGAAGVTESADRLARHLLARGSAGRVLIGTSPSARCIHTASIIRGSLLEHLGQRVAVATEIDVRLEELQSFSWIPYQECLSALGIDSRSASMCNQTYHDGVLPERISELPPLLQSFVTELESPMAVRERVRQVCLETHSDQDCELSIIVTHDGCLAPLTSEYTVTRGSCHHLLKLESPPKFILDIKRCI